MGAESLMMVMSVPVLLTLGRRGAVGVIVPNVLESTASSSSSSSSVIQVGTHPQYLDKCRTLLPTGCA